MNRLRVAFANTCLLLILALPCAVAQANTVSPLPASDYTVRHACATPAPGHAGCMALRLEPATAAAREHTRPLAITTNHPIAAANPTEGAFGLRPQDLHSAYQLPSTAPTPQTIAIVDAYNDLTAEADLGVYDTTFNLPECTAANGCFTKVGQDGTGNLPFPGDAEAMKEEQATCKAEKHSKEKPACEEVEEAEGWAEEISLDIEVSHATCQNCKIVLVEARSTSGEDLEIAEATASSLGATEISNSWGGPEEPGPPASDAGGPFDRPGTVITASSGDDGYLDWDAEAGTAGFADYPASSPHVVAVGGTRLSLNGSDEWAGETVWNGNGAAGGGCSVRLTAQPWQQNTSDWSSVGCASKRAVADVSADADPYTGVAVYDSTFACEYEEGHVLHTGHWCTVGGTSLASPLIAATFALAGGANGVEYPARTLYENESRHPARLHDVLSGSNGQCTKPFDLEGPLIGTSGCTSAEESAQCSGEAICLAGPAYDGPTGVGTPDGIAAFQSPAGPVEEPEKERASENPLGGGEGPRQEGAGESSEEGDEEGGGSAVDVGDGGEVREGFEGLTLPSGAHPGTQPPSDSGAGKSTALPILSALALTRNASAALRHDPARISTVAFAFTLNVPARVRVTLAEQVLAHGRPRWQVLPDSLTLAAARGRDSAHLRAHGTLVAGRYRVTLTPLRGRSRSIRFRIAQPF